MTEQQSLGVPIQQPDGTLSTLFPRGGDALLRSYAQDITPKLDLTAMSMEDVLSHVCIVGNRLYRFGARRKKIS